MKRTPLFLAGLLLLTNIASALPPRQHLARGSVAAIGPDAIALNAAADAAKDMPTTFVIKVARTRLREDGRNAAVESLKVGQPVHVYYRKEYGVWVATEVAWKHAL
jgi:hypothetical protein